MKQKEQFVPSSSSPSRQPSCRSINGNGGLQNLEADDPTSTTWTKQVWIDHLDSYGYFLYMRSIQGHSGKNKVDPSLQDSVAIPYNWNDYMCHIGAPRDCNSVCKSGLIAIGKDTKEGRQTVFITAVDPRTAPRKEELSDATEPRNVPNRTRWKVYQNVVCWINLKKCSRQRMSILANTFQCYHP